MRPTNALALSSFSLFFSASIAFSQTANEITTQRVSRPIFLPSQLNVLGNDTTEENVIGTSFDSLLKDFTNNKCVTRVSGSAHFGPPTSLHSSTGVTEITRESQYASSTSLNLSAAYNSGAAHADASASYVASGKMNSYDSTALLRSDVSYAPQQYAVSDFKLTNDAVNFLRRGYAIFRQYCGDRFVTGFRRGGQFIATLTIHNSTDSEQVGSSAAISAGNSAGSVSATFSQFIEKSSQNGRLNYEVTRDGLNDVAPNLKADELVSYALSYATKLDALSTKPIVEYLTSDYGPLIFKAALTLNVDVPPWMHLLNDQFMYLFTLYRYRADLNYIGRHPEEFIGIDPILVSKQETFINHEIDLVMSWGNTCLITQGRQCPDNKANNVAAIPTYSAPRARPWVLFDPVNVTPQFIGVADRDMILELVGKWHNAPGSTVDINFSTNVLLQKAPEPPQTIVTAPRIFVPRSFAAYFKINDFGPSDNSTDQEDPIKGRLGAPLDDFVAGR
jgi:hypothetical protein